MNNFATNSSQESIKSKEKNLEKLANVGIRSLFLKLCHNKLTGVWSLE